MDIAMLLKKTPSFGFEDFAELNRRRERGEHTQNEGVSEYVIGNKGWA